MRFVRVSNKKINFNCIFSKKLQIMQLNITNQTIVAANQPTNVSLSNMLHIKKVSMKLYILAQEKTTL